MRGASAKAMLRSLQRKCSERERLGPPAERARARKAFALIEGLEANETVRRLVGALLLLTGGSPTARKGRREAWRLRKKRRVTDAELQVMVAADGSQKQQAAMLAVNRSTLYRRRVASKRNATF